MQDLTFLEMHMTQRLTRSESPYLVTYAAFQGQSTGGRTANFAQERCQFWF